MTYADEAQKIVDRVDAEGRRMSAAERDQVDALILRENVARLGNMLSDDPDDTGNTSGGLAGAMKAAGYDRRERPGVEVPFNAFRFGAAATFSGDYADAVPSVKTSPPLGADSRFLYPSLRRERVGSDETSVSSFRQKSRSLPTLSTMIRTIAQADAKPETATEAEVLNVPLHQIATVETGVPNIFLESAAFRSWINEDLTFAFNSAVDAHVIAQIVAQSPGSGGAGIDILEEIILAAEEVARHGYAPSVVAAAPEDLIGLTLLKQPTSGDYVFSHGGDMPLQGLRRVAVSGLDTPYVLDPSALGTLYMSPVRIASFEEEAGSTNTSTVRIEANGVFIVQRILAVAEAVVGS
jgi:hypothetical protein